MAFFKAFGFTLNFICTLDLLNMISPFKKYIKGENEKYQEKINKKNRYWNIYKKV